jgi:hypothetical protein
VSAIFAHPLEKVKLVIGTEGSSGAEPPSGRPTTQLPAGREAG